MTTTEMTNATIREYTILRNNALEYGDYFLAEYYENLIKEMNA